MKEMNGEMVCSLCGSPAEFRVDQGVWRHTGKPFEEGFTAQQFCDRYGYPIPVILIEKEICICAAIRMPDGELIRGHRHDSCYEVVRRRSNAEEKRLDIVHAIQGFITSRNRFVDRYKAMVLQRASGLPSQYREDGKYVGEELFSEDLY